MKCIFRYKLLSTSRDTTEELSDCCQSQWEGADEQNKALGRAMLAAALLAVGRGASDISLLVCGKSWRAPPSPLAWGLCLPLAQPCDGAPMGIRQLD